MQPNGNHPACLLFPKLTGPALDELAADIKDRGLIEPIVLLHGQVLDGKNRLAACRIAGVSRDSSRGTAMARRSNGSSR